MNHQTYAAPPYIGVVARVEVDTGYALTKS